MNTRVLSYWQPDADLADESDENKTLVGQQFQQFIGPLWQVRSIHAPRDLAEWVPEIGTWKWHQDYNDRWGDYAKRKEQFVLWTNVQPVEVRFIDSGELLEASDGAVVLIADLEVEHRTPWPLDPKRCFIRAD